MSGSHEIVPQNSAGKPVALRRPGNNDDMPMALLEFHSPSAAMAAMPPTATALYTTWIVSSLALASVLVMALFPIDRVATASGALVPTVPMVVVQPLETSIIRSIDVREGDVVHKGQILAHLDPTATNADVSSLGLQTRSLQAEVDRLMAEVTGKDYVADPSDPASTQQAATFLRRKSDYAAKIQNYDQQIAGLRSDVVGYEASAALYAGRVKVASDVHNMRVQLQRDQVGSRLNSLSAQDELMEIERSQITAQQSATSARNKLNAMIAEREGYIQNSKAETYQSLTDAQRKLYEATGQYEKAKLQKSLLVMRADRDAVVLNIAHVSVGSVITAAQEFMTLTPLDAPLQIEARLPVDTGRLRAAGRQGAGQVPDLQLRPVRRRPGGGDQHQLRQLLDRRLPGGGGQRAGQRPGHPGGRELRSIASGCGSTATRCATCRTTSSRRPAWW